MLRPLSKAGKENDLLEIEQQRSLGCISLREAVQPEI
jgi:hypothetical protein